MCYSSGGDPNHEANRYRQLGVGQTQAAALTAASGGAFAPFQQNVFDIQSGKIAIDRGTPTSAPSPKAPEAPKPSAPPSKPSSTVATPGLLNERARGTPTARKKSLLASAGGPDIKSLLGQ